MNKIDIICTTLFFVFSGGPNFTNEPEMFFTESNLEHLKEASNSLVHGQLAS